MFGIGRSEKLRQSVKAFIRGVSYLAPNGECLYFHVPGSEHGYIRAQKTARFVRLHIRHWSSEQWMDEVVHLDGDVFEIAQSDVSKAALKHATTLICALTTSGVFLLRDEPVGETTEAFAL